MKHLLMATGVVAMLTAARAVPVGVFNATISVTPPAPEAFMNITGVATVTVETHTLRYSISLARVTHVTNVILLDRTRAVDLYSGPASQGEIFQASGEVTASALGSTSLDDVRRSLLEGKAEIVVFTQELPTGGIRGRLSGGMVDLPDPSVPSRVAP